MEGEPAASRAGFKQRVVFAKPTSLYTLSEKQTQCVFFPTFLMQILRIVIWKYVH